MRPLLVTLDYPPALGGVAEYYRAIARHWPGGLDVLSPTDGEPMTGRVWPRWLPMVRMIMGRATDSNSFPLFIGGGQKGGLLMAGQVLPVGTAVALASWRLNLPYVVFTHGMDVAGAWESRRKRILARLVLRRAKLVVANSEFTKMIVKRYGVPEDKIVIVHPCPWFDLPSSLLGKEGKLVSPPYQGGARGGGSPPALLTVARLIPRKGADIALRALPMIWQEFPNLEYWIVGDGPEEARLRAIAKEIDPGGARVKFLGPKPHDELPQYYESCTIFVQTVSETTPDDVEGFGLVYLEANMFGKPVVAARVGGVGEAVKDGETGLLVSPGDPRAAAEAILRLLRDPALAQRLGNAGRARVAREFAWPAQMSKLLPLLRRRG